MGIPEMCLLFDLADEAQISLPAVQAAGTASLSVTLFIAFLCVPRKHLCLNSTNVKRGRRALLLLHFSCWIYTKHKKLRHKSSSSVMLLFLGKQLANTCGYCH